MKFAYSSGSRPLDGYTIKRGIGLGGFGQVYYAVSDAGKEVALKLIRDNLDVELRGMAQCLNLKHPNLVALYDIRKDEHGDSWVVMEYVSGESLSAVLNRHPRGLALDLVRQWFGSLARAIGHLHDNGIVHRDLKPANIFIENGQVKVGDYGLSKFISGSQRSAQTQSVGTVHYMAPEISTGNYGKQIDIYAAGVILYEMITGKVPFDGESAGEILMKHLTATPDLSKLPPGYAEVVGVALAKNPAHRYASFADMARALDAVGGQGEAAVEAIVVKASPAPPLPPSEVPAVLPAGVSGRTKLSELSLSLVLTVTCAALFSIIWAAMDRTRELAEFGATFYLLVLTAWGVLLPSKLWDQRKGDPWARRGLMLVVGLGLGLAAAWLNGWQLDAAQRETQQLVTLGALPAFETSDGAGLYRVFSYMSYFGLALFLMRWWRLAERTRARRFSFYPVLTAGVLSLVLCVTLWPDFNGSRTPFLMQGPVVLTLAAAVVQLVSPWEEPAPRPARRVRLRYA
jgi:hypothetical protein